MLSRSIERLGCIQWHIAAAIKLQRYSTQAEIKLKKDPEATEVSWERARPYDEIPSPSTIDVIKSFLIDKTPLSEVITNWSNKYGPLYRMRGSFGRPDTLIAMNPTDFPIIFRNEGQWPFRRTFDSFLFHRQVVRKDFFQGLDGLVMASGEKWGEMRSAVNPILMQPKSIIQYAETMSDVSEEFLQRIRDIRDPKTNEVPDTFEEELNCLTLEAVTAIALDTKLGLISKNRDTSEAKVIIDAVKKFFELSFYVEMLPPIWKFIRTPHFKELMKTLDTLTDISIKYVNEAISRIEKNDHKSDANKEKSVLEKLLNIEKRLAVVTALDLIFAGVDTTSSALTGILLCLAKNPEKQQKLFEEMRQVLPHKDSHFTAKDMANLPYLRACIKEALRYYIVISGTIRRLPVDVVLSGFRVPKGTDISISSNLLLRNEKDVPRANEYLPERWLRNKTENGYAEEPIRPFIYLPFGFGPRICVGRRIVDLELEVNVGRLVRNFNIEFNHPVDKPFKSKLINIPAIPLKFKFEERIK